MNLKCFFDNKGREIINKTNLNKNGDLRSKESIELLKSADIIVTNPPFFLFREYIGPLIEHKKTFLIIGSKNAISYKDVFGLIKCNRIWIGVTSPREFRQPDGSFKKFGNIGWFTNLNHKKRNDKIDLYKKYKGHEHDFPTYDNFNAIEVSKIPEDYFGIMGVPITFLEKYNQLQFVLIGIDRFTNGNKTPGKRILIKQINCSKNNHI